MFARVRHPVLDVQQRKKHPAQGGNQIAQHEVGERGQTSLGAYDAS